jgi:hypothetical protein
MRRAGKPGLFLTRRSSPARGSSFRSGIWKRCCVLRRQPCSSRKGSWMPALWSRRAFRGIRFLSVPNGAVEKPAMRRTRRPRLCLCLEALKAGFPGSRNSYGAATWMGRPISLRSDMAKMLGVARFWFVDWPEGCKDANDVLRHEGGGSCASW